MDNRTEQLADGVWRVEVGTMVNAYVLAVDGRGDGDGLAIVDTGTAGGGPRLVRSIRLLGFEPRAVREVLLTHWHRDHSGSAARFARSSAAPRVRAGVRDLPVVQGRQRRPQREAAAGDATVLGRLVGRISVPGAPVPEASALHGGARLDIAGGVLVVPAPGHTPGSLAFHLRDRGVLLAGDAVLTVPRLWRGPRALCSALSEQTTSLRRLAGLEFDVLAPGHGPPLARRARDRLAALAG